MRPLPAAFATLALAVAMTVAGGCRGFDHQPVQNSWPPVESAELGGMHNVSVSGGLWFGGVPSAADLDLAKRRGIVTVIDLCTPEELPAAYDLAAACTSLALERFHVGVLNDETITDEMVDQVLSILADPAKSPKLVFCGTGSRSAMFVAVYRTAVLGVPLETALVEARRAGMKPGPPEDFVRRQAGRLIAL